MWRDQGHDGHAAGGHHSNVKTGELSRESQLTDRTVVRIMDGLRRLIVVRITVSVVSAMSTTVAAGFCFGDGRQMMGMITADVHQKRRWQQCNLKKGNAANEAGPNWFCHWKHRFYPYHSGAIRHVVIRSDEVDPQIKSPILQHLLGVTKAVSQRGVWFDGPARHLLSLRSPSNRLVRNGMVGGFRGHP